VNSVPRDDHSAQSYRDGASVSVSKCHTARPAGRSTDWTED